MQEGYPSMELHLSLFRAGDGKVNRAQGVAGMLLDLASRIVRAGLLQDDKQAESEAQDNTMRCAFH
jgi:hypothetical protein